MDKFLVIAIVLVIVAVIVLLVIKKKKAQAAAIIQAEEQADIEDDTEDFTGSGSGRGNLIQAGIDTTKRNFADAKASVKAEISKAQVALCKSKCNLIINRTKRNKCFSACNP